MNVLAVIAGVFDLMRKGVGIILPIFSEAADFKTWNPWLRWAVRLALAGVILAGLNWVERQPWNPLRSLLLAKAPPWVQANHLYVDIMFLLVVAAGWVGYGLIRLFSAEEESAEFPEVEAAWRAAVDGLARAGVRLNDPATAPPVFVVVGRPAGGMDALFRASGWRFEHRLTAGPGDRVVVYACYDPFAVFVTAPDASGWAYLSAALDGDARHAPPAGGEDESDPTKTISFAAGGGALRKYGLSGEEEYELRGLLDTQRIQGLSDDQQDRLGVLADKGRKGAAMAARGQSLAIRAEVVRQGERELKFLAKLVKKDRWPLCPINGVLVLVPWAAGGADEVAARAAQVLADDLRAVRDALQLHYPTYAAVCDLETARGFPQFRSAFPPALLRGRLGQRTPLVPAGGAGAPDPPEVVRRGAAWIAQAVVPVWVLKALRLDDWDARSTPGGRENNRDLYLLMREVYLRFPRIAGILASGVPSVGPGGDPYAGLPLFGGCYLAGTGGKGSQQAFVEGVFRRMVEPEEQASVAWNAKAYAEDAKFRRLAVAGYGAIAAVVLVTVGAVLAGK